MADIDQQPVPPLRRQSLVDQDPVVGAQYLDCTVLNIDVEQLDRGKNIFVVSSLPLTMV